jgi:GT2 family glycosyltransferase
MVSYNRGFERARGAYIVVVDDDGLPASRGWISEIVDCFEANPRLGAVACTIRMRDTGEIAYDSPQFVPDGDAASGFPAAAYNGTGAGLRAAALRQVGTYPAHFFRSWLELHLCTRLIDTGWQVRHFPSLEVWHSRPSGSVYRPTTYHALRNYLWYVWTFYPWPEVVHETIHFVGSSFKLVLTGRVPLGRWIGTLGEGIAGWPRFSSERKPISRASLSYLRHVRRHGNDYGFAVPHRSYPVRMSG